MLRTYPQALSWIYEFADLERGAGAIDRSPSEFGVLRTARLLQRLGSPQESLVCLQIAGSKGKGSVCALVASAAQAAGLRVGLYSQPHLHTFRERFQVDGEMIARERFAQLAEELRPAVEAMHAQPSRTGQLTTFEIATTLALRLFAQERVDLAVMEVGLGGRLDATTAITPVVGAITTIVPEHTRLLGERPADIAREKAGIAKPGVPLIVARQAEPVLKAVRAAAGEVGAPVTVAEALAAPPGVVWRDGRPVMVAQTAGGAEKLPVGLLGFHQLSNAGVAMAACRALGAAGLAIPWGAIRAGFAAVHWPARLEVVAQSPLTLVDGAHTPEAVAAAVRSVRELLGARRGPVIFGALRDKRVPEMVTELRRFATRIFAVRPAHPRAWTPTHMLRRYPQAAPMEILDDACSALRTAQMDCKRDEAVLAIGSLALAADVRAAAGLPCESDPAPLPAN